MYNNIQLESKLYAKCYTLDYKRYYTVEPPNKGHYGAKRFVFREIIPIVEINLLTWLKQV